MNAALRVAAAELQTASAPRHIAIFIPTLNVGGAERVLLELAQEFLRLGHRIDLVLMWARETPLMKAVPAGVRIVDLKRPHLWTSTAAMARYIRTEQPDGIIAAMPLANAIAVYARKLARSSVRVVLSEHSGKSLAFGDADTPKYRLLSYAIRFAYRFADCIIGVSHGVSDRLRAIPAVARDRIRVVYNPYSPRIEQLAAEPSPHVWLEDRSTPVLLASGRLEAEKDFATLLRAFAKVRSVRPARLIVLGEGSLRASLEQLAGELGIREHVDFPGYVLNPWAYVSRARLFVLSSIQEGLPGVLIEALACGVPVVSTDCYTGPAEILEGGRYGALVPTNDPRALADAICHALDAPVRKQRLQERARAFSIDHAAAGYLDALGFSR